MLTLPDVAIGAIAAVIAGLVSLIGLIVSKEQKTSEFRQAWIDALRNEISELISHANAIHGASVLGSVSRGDAWRDVRADLVGINQAAAKIRLRLNPDEDPSQAILRTIDDIEKIIAPGKPIDHNELNTMEELLIKDTKVVLKEEWKRVKLGERAYRMAKILAFSIVLVFLCAFIGYAIQAVVFAELP